MKGTEKIIAHIRSDAQAQCDAILAAAQEKIDAIRADYDAQAAEAYAERIRAGVKSCADEGESAARLARMEAKKTLLALQLRRGREKARRAAGGAVRRAAREACGKRRGHR